MNSESKKVLICIDTSAHSYKVADKGISFARKLNAQISLLHVVNAITQQGAPRERTWMEKKKNKARKFIAKVLYTFSCAALIHIEEGDVAETILAKAASLEVDIIIMGNRVKKRASNKSVVKEVLRRAESSVLTI